MAYLTWILNCQTVRSANMGNKQDYHLNMQAGEQQRSYNLSTLIWLDLKGLLT